MPGDRAPDPLAADPFPQGPFTEGADRRVLPDYEGREPAGATFGEAMLWLPRLLFFPLYLVSEYVIRQPLGALVTLAERDKWLALLGDFFTFDEEQKIGLVPTLYLEFNFQPSVGFYFFADDVFADRNELRVHGALWPGDWWALTISDRQWNASETIALGARASLLIRPDNLYYGVGSSTQTADKTRYQSDTHEGAVFLQARPWRASTVALEMGVRRQRFDADTEFGSRSLAEAIEEADSAIDGLPAGFSGYTVFRQAVDIAIDTREAFPAPAHGVRLRLRGEQAYDVHDPVRRRWLRYGAELGGFVDIMDHRVVSLSVRTDFVDPLAGQVPFTELATLGGGDSMLGFQQGRLFGRSAALATLEYHWPVWVWADFVLHYSLGNVFGVGLKNFDRQLLRSSFGIGLRAARTSQPDHDLVLLVAAGTETIEQGMGVESVRFAVGGATGF